MEIQFYNQDKFFKWLDSLDSKTEAIIFKSIEKIRKFDVRSHKNIRDIKGTGGVFEYKIQYGSGYRIYFCQEGKKLTIILCGGDKGTQKKDIELASMLFAEFKEGDSK